MILIISQKELLMLTDDFKTAVVGLTQGVANLTQAVTDLSGRIAANPGGGSVSDTDVKIAIASLNDAAGQLQNATNQLGALLPATPPATGTGPVAVPAPAPNFASPLK
jgi:hypothetical protein